MKIIPFLLTGFVLALGGVILYFVLNNSLSELTSKQAQPGIIFFVGFAIVITLSAAILSGVAANYFIEKKEWKMPAASLLTIPIFTVIGIIVMIIGVAISVAVVDAARF